MHFLFFVWILRSSHPDRNSNSWILMEFRSVLVLLSCHTKQFSVSCFGWCPVRHTFDMTSLHVTKFPFRIKCAWPESVTHSAPDASDVYTRLWCHEIPVLLWVQAPSQHCWGSAFILECWTANQSELHTVNRTRWKRKPKGDDSLKTYCLASGKWLGW